MGKVRYKEPSPNFEKIATVKEGGNARVSIGNEGAVGEYYFLSIDHLLPYHKQARRLFDEKELNELAQTIKEHGINNPLLVIKSEQESGKFEVVSGERRLRAAKIVGLTKLPCIIINENQAEEVALIENIQRADLHPIEIGDGINKLLANANWGDLSKLAEKLGKDHSTLSGFMSYSKFPDSIKAHLVENNIRSREILRRLLKCSDLAEMETVLGVNGNSITSTTKSVLRISLSSDMVKVQDKSLYTLSLEQRNKIKAQLIEIIKKIDAFS